MHRHSRLLSLRTLIGVALALAVLLAPATTRAAVAFGGLADHQMQMMEAGHCQLPPSGSADHDKNAGKSCCISISVGLAAALGTRLTESPAPSTPAAGAPRAFVFGHPSELPTPPPKLS